MSRPSRRWRAAIRQRDTMRPARSSALLVIEAHQDGVSLWKFQARMSRLAMDLWGLRLRQRDAACRPLLRFVKCEIAGIDKAAP